MNASAGKDKPIGRDEKPLDTTNIKPIKADSTRESTEVAKVSSVAS
jgi:hypothetical protein